MQIKLEFINESQTSFALGDRDKIQQVFMNLISNSIKYGKNGEIYQANLTRKFLCD